MLQKTSIRVTLSRGLLAAAMVLPLAAALVTGSANAAEPPGAVYVLSNQATENSVLVYNRASDGTISYSATVPTGGTGAGTGGDPLASQGALVYSNGLLFAVNAGTNDVSMFAANDKGLVLLDKAPSGGVKPVSIAVHGLLAYVLNQGGTPNAPNISAFVVDPFHHRLVPLPNSQRPLAGGLSAAAAEVSFNASGRLLLVTEKGTNQIDTYKIDNFGYASQPTAHASSGNVPFGFSVTKRGYAVVSEAASGAASSYDIEDGGALELVTGSISLGQKAPCWLVTTGDGRYAFTANAGSGSISSLAISPDGTLSIVQPVAGVLSAPLDMAVTPGSQFLYAREGTGLVSGFRIGADGSLTAVNTLGGIPAGAQGIAVR